jgi:succinate dehydrogenase/fumarate reductase cytochrome b subunit
MKTRQVHFTSGILLTLFIAVHLFNHFTSLVSIERHIEVMRSLRTIYRNPVIETILLLAVGVQISSGISLFRKTKSRNQSFFEKLHILTGLYLAFFLIIHVSAVLVGRIYLKLDTNFYFGAAGINSFPVNLFFIPYYALAIISFFGHIASIHSKKMKRSIGILTSEHQAIIILVTGILVTLLLFYGLTNHFKGINLPQEYHLLIGK